jgi:hypothetical protein
MAKLTDLNNPTFLLLPVNNNRTGWKNFGLPVVLVVPHRRSSDGTALPNSSIFGVRVYIEDVPREARVAGHQNIGRRYPDKELYAETIDALALAEKQLDLGNLVIRNSAGGIVDLQTAITGDTIEYITATGIHDTITYVVGADYYDLSEIAIDVELLPADRYNLVYEAQYFKRVISSESRNEFLCIDASARSLALLKFKIDHPGKVLNEFYRLTPPPYLTNAAKSKDTTIALYRPFTDILQDVMDEQDLLERINWVFDAPAEAIPYLSSLLGWDIPYFPESLDQLRRAVLRRTVELQNLKGSRRAIINIFRLFGFEILISNLWWSSDGKRLISPDERLPLGYQDQEIVTVGKNQVDVILADYSTSGFAELQIPLLFRPQEKAGLDKFTALRDGGNVTVVAYVVADGGPAHLVLRDIANAIASDPAGYGDRAGCIVDADGFIFPGALQQALDGKELAGFSQIHIAGKLGDPADEILAGPMVPLTKRGVSLNRELNTLSLSINGYVQLAGYRIYAFVAYRRYEFNVPAVLESLQSNRFDIQVLTQDLNEFADPVTLEFAVEFLYRLKAFHSLLNVIRTRIELTETYEVTDLCIGGDFEQRYDTDIGRLQVPPAIIPQIPADLNNCTLLNPHSLGYKDSDILLRARKLANMPEEHAAWKVLDGREVDRDTGDTRIIPSNPAPDRDQCKFTHLGQDRIAVQARVEVRDILRNPTPNANMNDSGFPSDQLSAADEIEDINSSSNSDGSAYGSFTRERTEIRKAFCETDNLTDYCYKGRVDDELLYRPTLRSDEHTGFRPIYISMGIGVYWAYPALTKTCRPGVRDRDRRGLTKTMRFSGGAPDAGLTYYQQGVQGKYLTAPYNQPLAPQSNSFLGRLYRDYGSKVEETLHYSNRRGEPIVDQKSQLALQRPSLEIFKTTLHLPGCRFPMMQSLLANFTHPTYQARPWDDDYCGPRNVCGKTDPAQLNYRMEVGDDGNEYLTFDKKAFTIVGNGLPADISSLGEHTLTDSDIAQTDVIHKVYMGNASEGSPAVSLDGVCDYDTAVNDGAIETSTPIFQSHNKCATSDYLDYADGYPCVSGYQTYVPPSLGQGIYDDILDAIGIPSQSGTGAPAQVLFLLGSGIRSATEKAYRLDGGCLVIGCDVTAIGGILCSTDKYLDEDGLYNFEPDHLQVEARLLAIEEVATDMKLLDASIPSLLETY